MSNNLEFSYSSFDQGKIKQLSNLFQSSWQDQADQVLGGLQLDELLTWRYAQNPAGNAFQFVATNQDQWVGHIGIEPQRIKVGTREALAFQAGHVLVAKAFQGKWIFSKLAQQLHSYLATQGDFFIFGFPNKAAFPVWRRNGWKDLVSIPTLALPLRWKIPLSIKLPALNFLKYPLDIISAVVRRLTKRQLPKGYTIGPVSKIEAEFDQLWAEAKAQFSVATVRDAAYLQWRYCAAPKAKQYSVLACRDSSQKLVGYVAVLKETIFNIPALVIMDVLIVPGAKILPGLISAAVDYGWRENLSLVITIMQKNSPYYQSLLGAGFMPVPERFLMKSMILSGRMKFSDQSTALIKNPSSWQVTFGDWDGL